jgi:pyrroline-5-carboxylate reductase
LPAQIVVSDPNPEVLSVLKEQFPQIETVQDNRMAAKQDLVFVSLHPPVLSEQILEFKDALNSEAILISLAPKVSISKLTGMLGGFNRIVRMIPNAPSIVNQGFNPVVFHSALPEKDKTNLIELFDAIGNSPEVDEGKLEAYAILTAMGPTYFWFQLYQLMELGKSFGFDEAELKSGIKGMVEGMLRTMFDSGLAPKAVMDLIPVKPLGEDEENIKETYRKKLSALYQKLKS